MAATNQMDSAEHLADICARLGTDHRVITLLDQNGYTTPALLAYALPGNDAVEEFAYAVFPQAGLLAQIAPVFTLPWASHPEVAQFCNLWLQCWQVCSNQPQAKPAQHAGSGLTLEPQVASWLDLPPPRLAARDIIGNTVFSALPRRTPYSSHVPRTTLSEYYP